MPIRPRPSVTRGDDGHQFLVQERGVHDAAAVLALYDAECHLVPADHAGIIEPGETGLSGSGTRARGG